jgi:hypothetical protein
MDFVQKKFDQTMEKYKLLTFIDLISDNNENEQLQLENSDLENAIKDQKAIVEEITENVIK